jgi:hypothetical protein
MSRPTPDYSRLVKRLVPLTARWSRVGSLTAT